MASTHVMKMFRSVAVLPVLRRQSVKERLERRKEAGASLPCLAAVTVMEITAEEEEEEEEEEDEDDAGLVGEQRVKEALHNVRK